MKKYNSFLGAFFSGDNGQGGYNAAYGKSALAKLYTSQDPAEQQMAAEGLARVDPESAGKWQEEQAKVSQQRLEQKARMLASLPSLEQKQSLYASMLPEVRKNGWAEAPDQYTPELDNALSAWAGVSGQQSQDPADVRSFQYFTQGMTPEQIALARQKQLDIAPPSEKWTYGETPSRAPYRVKGDQYQVLNPQTQQWQNYGGNQPPRQENGYFGDLPPGEAQLAEDMYRGKEGHYGVKPDGTIIDYSKQSAGQSQSSGQAQGFDPFAKTDDGMSEYQRKQLDLAEKKDARDELAQSKPKPRQLPVAAQKIDFEIDDALSAGVAAMEVAAKHLTRIGNGEVKVSPVAAATGTVRRGLGVGNAQDANYAELKADITKIVNDSLRLNKGVQTEGDAQRAYKEVMDANDEATLVRALSRMIEINKRGVNLQRQKRQKLYQNYGIGGQPAQQAPAAPAKNARESLLDKY